MAGRLKTVDTTGQQAQIDSLKSGQEKLLSQITSNIELTRLFTIIVAATLVLTLTGTLIGLGGLYISAFNNAQIQHEDDIQKDTLDKVLNEMMKISEKTYANENQQKLLKQKNPYLK